MKIVYVEWIDSCTTSGWRDEDRSGASLIKSVGIEVSRNERTLVLSTSRSDGGRYVDQMSIPMEAGKKIRRIKLK